ncbi:MAG: ABC transporter permease [Clostridia bacterium]|nr:ABC transporter permease [Clostridia bacterium]
MKRTLNFAFRNVKEILRDPLSSIFALILPLFLLWIFQQFDIPSEAYLLKNFTPGIIIFGFSFITMFTAVLVSKDKTSSLLLRLSASPMKSYEYILGYFLALLPLVIIQELLFILTAVILGLTISLNFLYAILLGIGISLLYIALGILLGSIVSDKAAPSVSSVIVQLVAFTSGMYFSSDLIGGFFKVLCNVMPFKASVDLLKNVLNGNNSNILLCLSIFLAYLIISIIFAVIFFKKSLKSDKK